MTYLGPSPTTEKYADAVSEKMDSEGRDRSSWIQWKKTVREVIRGNGVFHPPSASRVSKSVVKELRRRAVVVTKAKAHRRKDEKALQERLAS